MKKELVAIIIATLISSAIIPLISTIKGIECLDGEVMRLPYDYPSLGHFSNLCVMAIITGFGLFLLKYVFYFKPLQKAYIKIIYFITWLLTLIESFCLIKFELSISPPMMSIMGDVDNLAEIRSFFDLYWDWASFFGILALIVVAWALWHFAENIANFILRFKKTFIAIFILLIVFAITGQKLGGNSASTPLQKTIYSLNHSRKISKIIAQMAADKTNKVEIISDKSDTAVFIFIIGESGSRNYMGIYNKNYDSTPLCQKLIDSGNMFAFTDTVSMKSVTALCIPPLICFMDNSNTTTDLSPFDSIVDVFDKANYQTFWLSNHEKITRDMSYATVLSMKSTHSAYTAKIEGTAEHVPWLCTKDDLLLKPLDEFIDKFVPQKEKNFFVFHLMGSHGRYIDRYPENFNRFKSEDVKDSIHTTEEQKTTVAQYLNSIYFTDYVISEILSRFKDMDAIMVYVPDHGEELWEGGFLGHGPTNVSKYMVEIPMLMWVSDKYKEKRPENIERIKKALHRPYMTDLLAHTLADLAGIEIKQFDATKSIVNDAFVPRDRIIFNNKKYEDLRK